MATVDGILLPRGDVGENGGNYALYTGAGVVSSSAHADSQPFKFSGDRPRGTLIVLPLTICANQMYALTE